MAFNCPIVGPSGSIPFSAPCHSPFDRDFLVSVVVHVSSQTTRHQTGQTYWFSRCRKDQGLRRPGGTYRVGKGSTHKVYIGPSILLSNALSTPGTAVPALITFCQAAGLVPPSAVPQ